MNEILNKIKEKREEKRISQAKIAKEMIFGFLYRVKNGNEIEKYTELVYVLSRIPIDI